jgi:hypothetical protein
MKALLQLSEMDFEAKARKYPSVPSHCLPRTKFTDKTANGLTKAVLQFLALKGHYASRIQSQGQYNEKLGRWTSSTVRRGIGDIMAVINGRSIMIEIKVGRDIQSEHQKKTQGEVEASGGVYLIVRSFSEFMDWYVVFI